MPRVLEAPSPTRTYNPDHFTPLFASEDRHFWFRARNTAIELLVRQIIRELPGGYRVLEVGCGTGNVLRVLQKTCTQGIVVGMDLFADGLQYARRRTTCSLVQADVHSAPFSNRFELIGLFDVLEHLPDDIQVLRDLQAMLAPGGGLLVTVPAHPSLWSHFDEASDHRRRYEVAELDSKLRQTGYTVEYRSEFMATIFPLLWLSRRFPRLGRRRPAGDASRTHDLSSELRVVPLLNDVLTFLLTREADLIGRRFRLPLGTSIVALARKARLHQRG